MATSLLLATQCAAAANLVDARWLEKNLQNADVLLIDAQPPQLHAKAHIPGAVNIDVFTLASFGVRDLPAATTDKLYQAAGISKGKRIVLYDQGGTWFAPRVFFALTYHGFPTRDLYILDGGIAKWQAEGLPVTKDPTPAPKAGTFRITRIDETVRARPPEMLAATGDRANKVLVDALGPEYHYGGTAFFNKAGHIPHSVLFPSEELFNADKTFKSPEEIRRMLAHVGVRPEQEITSYCGGGGAAAVPYFAIRHIAGYSKVKLSVESHMGWLQDDRDLPTWTYAAPAMMRETDWLSSWGGKMLRMYGVSKVSVVDVRPGAAYGPSHVPFAVNVPVDVFRDNVSNPGKLAEVLGASGVDASHEAVVISGAGLTKEAALAYVMLEKLGQRKVSVFMDSLESVESLDKMSRKGFAVTKEATKVPATTYPVSLRTGITISDAKAAGGAYPKVFVASGASVPAKAPEGKVVHLPYTKFLKPDGTPKEAKEILAILTKAGVSRYAELVAFSDDPGEAAANYFVLKLMGYSDVKVLVEG